MNRAAVSFVFAALVAAAAAEVKVAVGERAMKTYPFSDPDPVPCVRHKRYPYHRFDGSMATGTTQTWQLVTLDNGLVRVSLTPEIGGKVWGARDLATGCDFIYDNRVVKFRDIATRGPWTAGGLEFNFGFVGHANTCSTPVDWMVRTNADGSASCFVAAEEYATRTRWQVEVRLAPGAREFETHTLWHNPSGLPQPYYHWMNAAFSLRGNPRFLFPGAEYIGHAGDVHPWPLDGEGHDLSVYDGNDFGGAKSEHILPGDNTFYGIWWPQRGIGACHRNGQCDKYGRKIFLWAHSRAGGIWEDLLTEGDGQYGELQSGRCFQQPTAGCENTPFSHPSFRPGATERFVERWGVLASLDEAGMKDAPRLPVPRPSTAPADFDREGAYGLYLKGRGCLGDRDRNHADAEAAFRAALAKDPWFSPARTALAALEIRRGATAECHAHARRLLALDAYDPEANYLDGFAWFIEGDNVTARDRLGVAAFDLRYRSQAYQLVARTYLREGDLVQARQFAERALAANAENLDALLVKALALRGTDEGAQFARELLERYPLYHTVRYLVEGTQFKRYVRCEMPEQTFIEWGSWFEESGLSGDASAWFALAGNHPVAALRKAFLERDAAALDGIAAMPIEGVFPFRRESLPALRWAAKASARWQFRYYLAVAAAAFNLSDEAAENFALLDEADRPVVFLLRAQFRDGEARLADLRRAEALGASWRGAHALCAYYRDRGEYGAFLAEATRWIARYPRQNAIKSDYAEALQVNGKNRECLEYLRNVVFLPSELRGNVSSVWRRAQRALGLEVTYPEQLGSGRPYPDDPEAEGE